jgi:hypothetical protein
MRILSLLTLLAAAALLVSASRPAPLHSSSTPSVPRQAGQQQRAGSQQQQAATSATAAVSAATALGAPVLQCGASRTLVVGLLQLPNGERMLTDVLAHALMAVGGCSHQRQLPALLLPASKQLQQALRKSQQVRAGGGGNS